jgi:HD-like signal output (HDOD) protein/signal transduction histidine kinase
MGGVSKISAAGFDAGQLPSIPQVLLKLIEACHKVDVSYQELADIIQMDAGLSAKIIAVANSPAYAQWNDVKDFNRLLVVLGLNTIKTIAITSAVHQFFSQFNPELGRWMGTFWRYSLTSAYSAKALAKLTGYESVDEAYLAGLLHRIGQLVLLRKRPQEYPDMLLGLRSEVELEARERELFGSTGTEIGALISREWDPQSFLSDAILCQRAPAEAVLDTPRLVKLVNFTHKLAEQSLEPEVLYHEAELLFGLSQPVIEELLQEVDSNVARAAEGLGIKLDDSNGVETDFYADGEEVRLALARQVRKFALLDGVRQHLDGTEQLSDTLVAIFQDLKILFGLSRCICFLLDNDSRCLLAEAGNVADSARVGEFRVRMEPGISLVSEALLLRAPLSSFDQQVAELSSVVDGQLCKLLDCSGMVCIPLVRGDSEIGVLVAGVDAAASQTLANQKSLLDCFADAASSAVQQRRRLLEEGAEMLQQERRKQQSEIKKLVHEANNPLAIIKNYLQVLSHKLGDQQGVQEQFAILNEEIERVGNLILRMREPATGADLPQGAVDINGLITDLLEIFRLSQFERLGIREDLALDAAVPPIVSSRSSIKQVLTNLLKNATEAMPDGGEIELSTRDRVNVNGRQYIELRVADSGPGIPPQVMAKLFTPLQSSKGREHSGLGLTIVKNLVSDVGGSISCSNKKKGGAEFVILLPRRLVE